MIHILHICSDFSRQVLYSELFLELAQHGVRQTIFVPVRSKDEVGKYNISKEPSIRIVYAHILKKRHRILYHFKLKSILSFLQSNIDLNDIDIVHAHFLFSDGGVAFFLKQKYGIPYFVTVRNTDVNFFFKYLFYLRRFGHKILYAAEQILFVTPSYRKLLGEKYCSPLMRDRILVAPLVPNGLRNAWFQQPIHRHLAVHNPLKLLYVGDFTTNKNILHLLRVVKRLNKQISARLTLVGGGGDGHNEVLAILKQKGYEFASYIGRVHRFEDMRDIYCKHDIFVMISKLETFGLVYLEAMSQGMPVVHTAGQGIDGYFKGSSFAIPVKVNDVDNFIDAILRLTVSFEIASIEAVKASRFFSWPQIAKKFIELYTDKLNK